MYSILQGFTRIGGQGSRVEVCKHLPLPKDNEAIEMKQSASLVLRS